MSQDSVSNVTNAVVSMLLEHNLKSAAVAVQKAVGVVTAKESGGLHRYSYSPSVNKYLCEALFFTNSLNKSNPAHKAYLKKLIESYREVNGVSGTADIDSVDAETDTEEDFISVTNGDLAQLILDNTELGQEYLVNDIAKFYHAQDDGDPELEVEMVLSYIEIPEMMDDVRDALGELVSLGYFEVTERDEYNGHITSVLRIQ